jgi:Fic family protein
LLCNPAIKDVLVARNAIRQFGEMQLEAPRHFQGLNLSPELLCKFQGFAIGGVYRCAGNLRDGWVGISNTPHQPPDHGDVPSLVAEMCQYANSVWENAFHCSAYIMWRLNWIHPFNGANGRTSRVISYLALCAGLKTLLPGTVTIPEQIQKHRSPYYLALQKADEAYKDNKKIDVTAMEYLLMTMLKIQLASVT